MSRARAVTHPNIALSKYWGKRAGEGNMPAVPSLSVALSGMHTETVCEVLPSLAEDELVLDGGPMAANGRERCAALLDRVRARVDSPARARVVSRNDFPTGAGLASSASGFAALALAAVRAYGLDASIAEVSDLARRSSASAARSLFGGFAELAPPPDAGATFLAATPLAGPDAVPLRVLVCVVTESAKDVPSTAGMNRTRDHSPFYAAWLDEAPRVHAALRAALLAGDLPGVGELAERSALAMHASAIAAGVIYFGAPTLAILSAVRGLRARGIGAWATIDAGPHVKVLVDEADRARVASALHGIPGVLRVIEARPAAAPTVEVTP